MPCLRWAFCAHNSLVISLQEIPQPQVSWPRLLHYSNLPPGSYSLWTCLPCPCPRAFVLAAVSGWNPLPLRGWCLTSLSSVAVRTGWDSTLSTQTLYTFSGQLGYLIKETHALKPAQRSHHSNKGYLWMRVSISFTLKWPISPLSASDLTWVQEPSRYH